MVGGPESGKRWGHQAGRSGWANIVGIGWPLRAGEPLARIEVADLQLHRPAESAGVILGHGHHGPLPNDVPAEAEPGAPFQLEAKAARLRERALEGTGKARWLEREEPGPYPPGMGAQAPQDGLVADGQPRRQVDDEQIHGPAREERPGQAEALVRIRRADDDEPAQIDATTGRLERIERPGEVQPGDDRAMDLGLRHAAERERRLARRGIAMESGAGAPGQAARGKDPVERREAGRDGLQLRPSLHGRRGAGRQRLQGERAVDPGPVSEPDRSAAPSGLQAGERRVERGSRTGRGRPHGPSNDRTNVRSVKVRRGHPALPLPTSPASRIRHGRHLDFATSMDLLMRATTVGTGSSRSRTILVVDDDAKIVRLVRAYLEREGFRVLTAGDGLQALERFRERRPDLIVLDLMLPELDGLEVCRAVRAESNVPILMLSARSSLADRIHGLDEGADDYLPKPFSPAELVVRAKAILRRTVAAAGGRAGDPEAGPGSLRHADLLIDLERHEVRRGEQLVPLTGVELRLLAALVAAGGRVLSRDQLLDALYGQDEAEILDRTIDVHVGRLRDKLGDSADEPRYVATVRGVGYRAAPEAPAG